MASSSIDPPSWNWPEDVPGRWVHDHVHDEDFGLGHDAPLQQESRQRQPFQQEQDTHHRQPFQQEQGAQRPQQTPPQPTSSSADSTGQQQRERHYSPRTCRICLETVLPTYNPPSEALPTFMRSSPSVTFETEDGGRLLRPCLCKGSQKYVHEQCLQAWRLQDPLAKRNYWQCPTCRYKYRLERMTWGRYISSTASQIMLTIAIFVTVSFALGYVADPIINLYIDPYDTITHGSQPLLDPNEPVTWAEHFVKGLASLGLLGFAKFLLTLSPWHWYQMRTPLGGGGRATGRDRMAQISWIAVVVGIVTVFWAVWKGVRAWSRRALAAASERVMDVPGADDDDDDNDE